MSSPVLCLVGGFSIVILALPLFLRQACNISLPCGQVATVFRVAALHRQN